MTTTEPAKPVLVLALPKKTTAKPPSVKPTTDTSKAEIVTLEALAREMKMTPRDARMLLRLASKQTKTYPTLGKDHVARQPWQWTAGSTALEEARKALSAST